MNQICVDCNTSLHTLPRDPEASLGLEHRCTCGRLYRLTRDVIFFPPGPPIWLTVKEAPKTYVVPITIRPDGAYCGSCDGWGTPGHENFCCVFKQGLKFYDADKLGCGRHGYRRCDACLAWERAKLGPKKSPEHRLTPRQLWVLRVYRDHKPGVAPGQVKEYLAAAKSEQARGSRLGSLLLMLRKLLNQGLVVCDRPDDLIRTATVSAEGYNALLDYA